MKSGAACRTSAGIRQLAAMAPEELFTAARDLQAPYELVAEVATRVLVIADGELVADGPTADVVVSSPAFAPQVAKVLAPLPWLTVAEVAEVLTG